MGGLPKEAGGLDSLQILEWAWQKRGGRGSAFPGVDTQMHTKAYKLKG